MMVGLIVKGERTSSIIYSWVRLIPGYLRDFYLQSVAIDSIFVQLLLLVLEFSFVTSYNLSLLDIYVPYTDFNIAIRKVVVLTPCMTITVTPIAFASSRNHVTILSSRSSFGGPFSF